MTKRSPLIHSQINLIKFGESNKFNRVYSKIWNIFARSNFLKIWRVLIHQISWIKNIKSNFKSPQRRKIEENKTTNESTWNIFLGRFSFGVLASLIFVISSFTKANNFLKHWGIILNFILSPLLNGIQTNAVENTEHYLLHCFNFTNQRTVLFDDLRNLGISYGPLDSSTLSMMLLFGNPKFSDNVNSGIIYAVIKFIESTNRFSGSIYD